MEISGILLSVKAAVDIAKLIKESDTSLEKAETKLKLAELISSLADIKIQASEIQQTLLDRESEVRELRDLLSAKEKLQWEKPFYWLVEQDQKDGPYCQKCYDVNGKYVRLQGGNNEVWACFECKGVFHGPNYQRPSLRRNTVSKGDTWLDHHR
jgi:ribosomal protein L37AE/L43A